MMEFSQYVLDAIASIDYMTKENDTKCVCLLREASEKAPSTIEAHILDIIAGASTMCYKEKEHVFVPLIIWNDGSRTFAPEDLEENDLNILCDVIQITKSYYLRTKFSHIIWLITKNNRYAEIAVEGYIYEFEKQFDPEKWVGCYEQICAAYHISFEMGKNLESFKQTRTVINQKLLTMNGSDTLFLSLKLLELILKDALKDDLIKYDSIICILANRNFASTNLNINLADATFSILEKLYRRMNKKNNLNMFKEMYAGYYEAQAKLLVQKNDYFRAVIMCKKACNLYTGINREKLLELRFLLEEWQKIALKEMHIHKFEIDLNPIYNEVEQMFKDLSLTEAIVQFGRVAKIYHIDDIKKKLYENQEQYIFTSMFGSSILNEQGQSVQELPSIRDAIESDDSDSIKKHMVHYIAEQRRLCDTLLVRVAYQFLSQYGPITEDDLNFLIVDNAIVPEQRAEIIKQGLCMGLNGKLYAAMHILQPQTENIFRNLVKMCGDTVTFLNEDGTEAYKPLSSLFKSAKLRECYDESIIFTFQSIMDEPTGENLRNLNAHGLLEPNVGNSASSLYFLSLLVFLLSLYGAKPCSIRGALAKREQIDVNEQDEKSSE